MHGAAMGAEEAAATRKALGWNYKEFEVPQEVYDVYHKVGTGFNCRGGNSTLAHIPSCVSLLTLTDWYASHNLFL